MDTILDEIAAAPAKVRNDTARDATLSLVQQWGTLKNLIKEAKQQPGNNEGLDTLEHLIDAQIAQAANLWIEASRSLGVEDWQVMQDMYTAAIDANGDNGI